MANQCVWFDIPVLDLDRAIKFYSAMLGTPVKKEQFPGMTFGLLPHQGEEVGGCLCVMENVKPSAQGPLLYLNAEGRLDQALAATQSNGGKVLQPKHQIGPYGFRAIILDSEGNRIALHSK
jgi:predicted enzyme related to lactoylglutathione lyase